MSSEAAQQDKRDTGKPTHTRTPLFAENESIMILPNLLRDDSCLERVLTLIWLAILP